MRETHWKSPDADQTVSPITCQAHPLHHRRDSFRQSVSCSLQLCHEKNIIIPDTVEDLGLTGVLVTMDTRDIGVGDSLEVWVGATDRKQQSLEFMLPAEVVRITDHGAAIRFRPYPDKACTEPVNQLYAS